MKRKRNCVLFAPPFRARVRYNIVLWPTEFRNRVRVLKTVPLAGTEVPKYKSEAIRELYEAPIRIIYRVLDDAVQIIALWHINKPLPRTPPG